MIFKRLIHSEVFYRIASLALPALIFVLSHSASAAKVEAQSLSLTLPKECHLLAHNKIGVQDAFGLMCPNYNFSTFMSYMEKAVSGDGWSQIQVEDKNGYGKKLTAVKNDKKLEILIGGLGGASIAVGPQENGTTSGKTITQLPKYNAKPKILDNPITGPITGSDDFDPYYLGHYAPHPIVNCEKYDRFFQKKKVEAVWGLPSYDTRTDTETILDANRQLFERDSLFREVPESEFLPIPAVLPGQLLATSCYFHIGTEATITAGQRNYLTVVLHQFDSPANASLGFARRKLEVSQHKEHFKSSESRGKTSSGAVTILDSKKLGTPIGEENLFYEVKRIRAIWYGISARKGKTLVSIVVENGEDLEKGKKYLGEILSALPNQPAAEGGPQVTAIEIVDGVSQKSIPPDKIPVGDIETECGQAFQSKDEKRRNFAFKVIGKNLRGSILSSNNISTNGKNAFYFSAERSNTEGTQIAGSLFVGAFAKEGTTSITAKNAQGQSANIDVKLVVTGKQYLTRAFFQEKVCLLGNWPEPMPNKDITELEAQIKKGLASIARSPYDALGILTYIYEPKLWASERAKVCDSNVNVIGCSKFKDNVIHISATDKKAVRKYPVADEIARLILHESAHKLHFALIGAYQRGDSTAIARIRDTLFGSKFSRDWQSAFGSVNPTTCPNLPLISITQWKTKDVRVPHCGFAWAYGASNYKSVDSAQRFSEDIATMTEELYFNPDAFKIGDGPTDVRYSQKKAILKKYGFLN